MRNRRLTQLAITAVAALIVDQVTKYWVVKALKNPGETIYVIDDFLSLVLTYNRQGIFGLPIAPGISYFFFPLLAIALVILFASTSQHFGFTFSYGLILGGAFGNLFDRLFRPEGVVDFICVRLAPIGINWQIVNPWFIWNIADGCLVVGVMLLLIFELIRPRTRQAQMTTSVEQPAMPNSKGTD